MIPDPKKLGKTVRQILFQSPEERQQEKELERDVQVRLGKARINRHIAHQHEMVARLTTLAKRALALNDEARFRQVGTQLLYTRNDIQRWEKYLLSLEVLEARRDQVKASLDLLQAVKTMSASLSELAGPQQVAELTRELETGLARAASLEERMEVVMEVMDATLTGGMQVDERALGDLQQGLAEQVAGEERAAFSPAVEAELEKIRQSLSQGK
jgi:hypothetical protein